MVECVAVSERVDVRRNRMRLLDAMRRVLVRRGVAVSMREVAREAGVGVATLYRHFPTPDDLLDAVLEDVFDELIASGDRALAEEDAWVGFTRFVEETLVLKARNRGLKDVIETRQRGRERAAAMRRRIRPVLAELVGRAQSQGSLRADFAPQDVWLLFWGSDRVIELTTDIAPDLWRRQLGFVLDGLRASAATPIQQPPLSEPQLRRVGNGLGPGVRRSGRRASDGLAHGSPAPRGARALPAEPLSE
jgi:AcrR family transcriptional regulator